MYCAHCGAPRMDNANFCYKCGFYFESKQPVHYAGFWKRFAAVLIDGTILFVIGFIISPAFSDDTAGTILGTIIAWLYFAGMESSSKQGTPGKMALGIKVTGLNGERIGFGRATGRHFAKFLSTISLLIGYIMAAFTKKKQALHDIIASTLVIKK